MNLAKLYEMQKVLDDRIMEEHPELKGQNNLDWKILALQVELGECANEWRGFKKWSTDQEPRTHEIVVPCDLCQEWTDYPHEVEGITETRNPLLEEYVDCLHFIMSIGLELGYKDFSVEVEKFQTTLNQFSIVYDAIHKFKHKNYFYEEMVIRFLGLGEMLGFTWGQIEQAYMDKNKINHERQSEGY